MPTPPGPKRVQYFFQCNDSGWSEEVWLPSSQSDTTALVAGVELLPFRLALLGTDAYCLYMRASDIFVTGDSQVLAFPGNAGQGTGGEPAEDPDLALTVRIQGLGSDTARRTYYMRGYPNNNTTLGNFFQPTPGFLAAFRSWFAAAQNIGMGIYSRVPGATQYPLSVAIQSPTTGQITVTWVGLATPNFPGSINIIGTKRMPALRGLHPLFAKPSPNFATFRSNRVLGTFNGTGFAQFPTWQFVAWGPTLIVRTGRRKCGRPFGQPVGRRSVQGLTPV